MPYLGKTPSQATRQRYYKTASGGETSISGTMTTGGTLTFNDGEFVDVKLNGVSLVAGTDYNTTTANTIGGLSALAANDQVEIVVYDTFSVFSGDVDSNLSVGGNLSVTGTSALTGAATITTDDNNPQLTLTTTDADAGTGPTLDLFRDSASPADADVGGKISFTGKNDAGETLGMTIFQASHVDVSDGTEDAKFAISSRSAGSMVSRLNLDATETVFNEDSVDVDFRVESNANTHMLFVDAAGEFVAMGTDTALLFNSEATSASLTVAGSDTSTTTIGNGGAAINIVQTNGTAGNTAGLHFSRADTDGTPNYSGAAIVAQFIDTQATGEYPKGRLVFNTSTTANAAPSEKMRIDNDGVVLIGVTSFTSGGGGIKFGGVGDRDLSANGTGAIQQLGFHNPNGEVGSIFTSGSATTFSTSSDYRIKENVVALSGAISRVKQLAPKRFNFIADADTTLDGFLAHEAQAVVPESVIGKHNEVETWTQQQIDDGDAPDGTSAGDNKLDDDGNTIPVMQGIDQSKLVPLLTGALQEAIAKIETLETKVAALEAGE